MATEIFWGIFGLALAVLIFWAGYFAGMVVGVARHKRNMLIRGMERIERNHEAEQAKAYFDREKARQMRQERQGKAGHGGRN